MWLSWPVEALLLGIVRRASTVMGWQLAPSVRGFMGPLYNPVAEYSGIRPLWLTSKVATHRIRIIFWYQATVPRENRQ
jgi:hypothetical protein